MTEQPEREYKNTDGTDDYEADQNLLGFFKLLLEVDRRTDPNFYKKLAKEQREEADKKIKKNPYAEL